MTHFSHLYRVSVLCKLNKNSIMVDRLVNSEANARRIAMVENCFGSSGQPLAEQGRVLVGEGVLTKMCRKKPKARQFFLFNDILVYGNIVINKKKYNKQHVIPLEEVKLESLKDEGQYRNGWLIRTASKSFAVYAATATEKEEWMAHIEKCIEDLLRKSGKQPPSEHAAVWVPDNEAAICMHCKKTQFTVLNRRHHCRKCGSVVCGPCSSKRYVLRGQSEKPLRVCLQCYDELTRDRARPAQPPAPMKAEITGAGSGGDSSGDDDSDDDDDRVQPDQKHDEGFTSYNGVKNGFGNKVTTV
ncbi:pleckstrin homology domain-containing family F member 2 isoform X2 [Vanessa tameamea]|uniref:Pleckstrin homology domain-containing family F member 2 isoform X2 n=1 Tax=Vanessa tameamea TaxID=334116 RepID=A0A8B8IBN9_VANTA|nr:pleckstrin homology domain-containing family F member 2 isoform X2 [Vanessa tameamea]XP_047536299.1 pleckstrin homology domain-containing family F member 2 isoform X2 [Vanessa atalanta]